MTESKDFEVLYHKFKNQIYNLALQYVQNTEDAQEITQDVFLTVHSKIDTFKNNSKQSTWIYRICINKCLDFLRAKKRKKRFSFLVSLFSESGSEISYDKANFNHPGIQLEQKEALIHLFSMINDLPENQKTALILAKIEHKPQAEIAEIMELSPKAVESLLQRAKNNLQKKISSGEGKRE